MIDVPGRRPAALGGQAAVPQPAVLDADRGASRRRRHRLSRPAPARRRRGHRGRAGAGAVHPGVAAHRRGVPHRRAGPRARRARRPGRRERIRTRSASACTGSTCTPRPAATTTSTSPARPFQIPLGALIPVRIENLLPAAKNIGTTHITNGCYRLHPVEWNVGEVAGELAAHCLDLGEPAACRAQRTRPCSPTSSDGSMPAASSGTGRRSRATRRARPRPVSELPGEPTRCGWGYYEEPDREEIAVAEAPLTAPAVRGAGRNRAVAGAERRRGRLVRCTVPPGRGRARPSDRRAGRSRRSPPGCRSAGVRRARAHLHPRRQLH